MYSHVLRTQLDNQKAGMLCLWPANQNFLAIPAAPAPVYLYSNAYIILQLVIYSSESCFFADHHHAYDWI